MSKWGYRWLFQVKSDVLVNCCLEAPDEPSIVSWWPHEDFGTFDGPKFTMDFFRWSPTSLSNTASKILSHIIRYDYVSPSSRAAEYNRDTCEILNTVRLGPPRSVLSLAAWWFVHGEPLLELPRRRVLSPFRQGIDVNMYLDRSLTQISAEGFFLLEFRHNQWIWSGHPKLSALQFCPIPTIINQHTERSTYHGQLKFRMVL